MSPQVSVVIRTKNEEKFMGKVLKLLYDQTFKDFEVIVVDSGSKDKTLEIARKFPVRIIRIKQEDFNFGGSLNDGIEASRGKYICILSGHSIPISDTWLSDGIKVLRENKVAGLSGYWSDFVLGYFVRPIARVVFLFPPFWEKRRDFDPWLTNTNSLIKRDCWQRYHFDESLGGCEDYDWAVEMLSRGFNIVKLKKFSVFHSHLLVGRHGYWQTIPVWKKWLAVVDKKRRPSYTSSI